jgi:hypothetical protein
LSFFILPLLLSTPRAHAQSIVIYSQFIDSARGPMELYTASGWPVDRDGPLPVFTASRLRWYTGTVHNMDIITESTLESPLALESLVESLVERAALERAALWEK